MSDTVESNGYDLLPSELQAVIDEAVDLFSTVWLGAECYHSHRGALGPGCPEFIGTDALERGTLVEAADRGLRPCGNCSPTDYRRDDRELVTDGGRKPRPGPKRAELGEQLVEHDAVVCDVCGDEDDLSDAETGADAVDLWDDHVREVHDERPVATDGGVDVAIQPITFRCDECEQIRRGVPWAVGGGSPAGEHLDLDPEDLVDVCDGCMDRVCQQLGKEPRLVTDGGQDNAHASALATMLRQASKDEELPEERREHYAERADELEAEQGGEEQ